MSLAKAVSKLFRKNGNNSCADCVIREAEWISWNLGVFICERCARIHKEHGISQVVNRDDVQWNMQEVKRLMTLGNNNSKAYLESCIPLWYRTPTALPEEPEILVEQWIISKYLNAQFTEPCRISRLPCSKFGYLMKRGRDNDRYQARQFRLNESNDSLIYYVDDTETVKAAIPISDIEVSLSPEKMNKRNSMQISFPTSSGTRHIYVYHECAKEIIDWFMAIRRAKLYTLKKMLPELNEYCLVTKLPTGYFKEGKLSKTGSNCKGTFRERWFTLLNKTLLYHMQPMDSNPRGEIVLRGAGVSMGCRERTSHHQDLMFTIRVENRTYLLLAETKAERDDWIHEITMCMQNLN